MRRDSSTLDASGALGQVVWESEGHMDMSIHAFEE